MYDQVLKKIIMDDDDDGSTVHPSITPLFFWRPSPASLIPSVAIVIITVFCNHQHYLNCDCFGGICDDHGKRRSRESKVTKFDNHIWFGHLGPAVRCWGQICWRRKYNKTALFYRFRSITTRWSVLGKLIALLVEIVKFFRWYCARVCTIITSTSSRSSSMSPSFS